METDTGSRSNLLTSNFDSKGGGVGYSLCNARWSPEPVSCTVESACFPLHESLLTVGQTDIQSNSAMDDYAAIEHDLVIHVQFLCEKSQHNHVRGRERSQAPAPPVFSVNK